MPSDMTPRGDPGEFDRRIVSVLFADVVGFTSLSEHFDPEDMATVQDAYFSATRDTIVRYGGVVEKFIGDAVMAVFGAPTARDDDAERAVRAGHALIGAMEHIGARLGLEPGVLQLRVGVNTGEVVHATSGPDAGRVTGDTVNTAARLQTAASPGSILLGELAAMTVAETIETRRIGDLDLKGKAEPLPAWEALGPRAQPSRDAALGALRAPMVGRAAELATLSDALARVARARVAERCLIVAPPGVGKSRLLREFTAGSDSTVLTARVRPQGTAPYETVGQLFASSDRPLAEALEAAAVAAPRRAVIEREVARLHDSSNAESAPSGGSAGDLGAEREARFDAWMEAFDALADGPSAWIVEDVHWAGGDLLAFLEHAAASPARFGRLIVTSARPSLLDAAPDWCASSALRIDLAPLPLTDARTLVNALLGPSIPEAVVEAIADASDGTPLFIEELLRTWASVGTLARDGDGWRLTVHPGDVMVPPTVQAIYAAQLDDLPPDARRVARRGSVAGRRVPVVAFETLGLDASGLGLETLQRRELLSGPFDDPITGPAYGYRHALLRDAAYASLARADRARLHVALASWLEVVAGSRVDAMAEAIAEHSAMALASLPALPVGDLPAAPSLAAVAARWYERAAEAALGISAVDAARRLFARSIELTPADAVADVARRRLRLGETLAASADLDLGIVELEAARTSLAEIPDAADAYEAATFALGMAYMQQIRFPEAAALAEEGISHLVEAGSAASLAARLHALHAWSLAATGISDGIQQEVDVAWEAAEASDDALRALDVLECCNAARDEIGIAGPEDWALLEDRARRLERWSQAVVAARVRAVLISFSDPRAALSQLEPLADEASAHGLTEQAGWVDYARCEALSLVGDWDAALEIGTRVLDVAERNTYVRLAFRTFMVILPIAAERRDRALADRWDRWWPTAEHHFPSNLSPYGLLLRGAYAVWLARAGDRPMPLPDPDVVDAIIPMENAHYVVAVETVIRAWLDADRPDLANAAASRWTELAAAEPGSPLMQMSVALVDSWVTGSAVSADRAAELAADIPAPWWVTRARGTARALRASDESH